MAEMFTRDFGVPDPVLLDDGSILVTFTPPNWTTSSTNAMCSLWFE